MKHTAADESPIGGRLSEARVPDAAVRISVVIPTHNGAHVLGTTLDHLARQDYPRDLFEVVVLDDGSVDDTRRVVEARAAAVPVRYVFQTNAGRAAARNAGARAARNEVILFLDADIWAQPDLLRQHARHYEGGERVGVQGPSRTHPASRVNPFMEVKELLPDLTLRRRQDLSPYHVITRNFSVHADDLWAVGGFDESFTGYGWEDIELGLRLRRAGVRLRWEPSAVTWHNHVEDLPTARRKQIESGSGAVYFWRKHASPFGLGMFLELHPLIRPLKWIVYRTGLFTPPIRGILRAVESRLGAGTTGWRRRLWLLIASECHNHLLWDAYYQGVWRALRPAVGGGSHAARRAPRADPARYPQTGRGQAPPLLPIAVRRAPHADPTSMGGDKPRPYGPPSATRADLEPRTSTSHPPSPIPYPLSPAVLIVSNGYGEDVMGAALARELVARGAAVSAYPLVGVGHSYQSIDIPLLDPRRTLPTAGFGFRTGVRAAWRDLRAGWMGLTLAQRKTLRAARGRFDRVVAIGDAFCLWMAAAAQPGQVLYVPSAKSELNEPHRGFEIAMIRRLAEASFPRDEVTRRRFGAAGLPAEYVGNLMMDCVEIAGDDFDLPAQLPVVLLLPGSRADAPQNLRLLLEAASRIAAARDDVAFLCALSPTVDAQAVAAQAGAVLTGNELRGLYDLPAYREGTSPAPTIGRGQAPPLRPASRYPPEIRAQLTRNFADAAARATVVLGMAGTANEQAAGLGKAVVALPGPGPQFTQKFLALQAKLLGEAVVPVAGPAEAAATTLRLLHDPAERARRGDVGRERMGPPGAARRLADRVLATRLTRVVRERY